MRAAGRRRARGLLIATLAFAGALGATPSVAQPAAAPSRGELLYRNHCIECHTSKMHWRDGRLATDWPGLVRQVHRWQGEAQLNWSSDDIHDVARHLNDTYYRFRVAAPRVGLLGRADPMR